METYSNNNKITLGRGKGQEILNAIKNARSSVKIVSPYLSPEYIKELIYLHNKGIKITLITCDQLETNQWSDFRPSDIIKEEKIINKKAKHIKVILKRIAIILFLLSLVSYILYLLMTIMFFLPIILIILTIIIFSIQFIIKDYDIEYISIFKLKVFDSKSGIKPESNNLIHSKIFLIDENILFLGSANFTYSAFKTHYETIIRVFDEKAINDITKEIENIYNSKELKEKNWRE
ncbi:MAG: phospholipase D-like domain-containing protein [Nanoarchaeota archaeon]|nr:phospholipase D-like domain-containing protein [Nanoarchaeota archaeon]